MTPACAPPPPGPLEAEVLSWVDAVWRVESRQATFDTTPGWVVARTPAHPWYAPLEESLRRLRARWALDELGQLAASLYFAPASWQPRREYMAERLSGYWTANARLEAVLVVIEACIAISPPPNVLTIVEARLRDTLRRPRPISEHLLRPTVGTCLQLLGALPTTGELLEFVEGFVAGGLNVGPFTPDGRDGWTRPKTAYEIHVPRALQLGLLRKLFEAKRLTYETFAKAAQNLPDILDELTNPLLRQGRLVDDPCRDTLLEFAEGLAWSIAQDLDESNYQVLKKVHGLSGVKWLIVAAQQHAAHRLGRLTFRLHEFQDGLDTAIVHLVQAQDVEPADPRRRESAIRALQANAPATLKALLPVAWHGRRILCEALGWGHAKPLVDMIAALMRLPGERFLWDFEKRASGDPTFGVVDLGAARAALARAGDRVAREVLRLFRQAKVGAGPAVTLLEAVRGWNKAEVLGGIAKRSQPAIRAYGLLPLERGEDEVFERVRFIKEFARTSRQFGMRRQTTERAARRPHWQTWPRLPGIATLRASSGRWRRDGEAPRAPSRTGGRSMTTEWKSPWTGPTWPSKCTGARER